MSRNFVAASEEYLSVATAIVSTPPFTVGCWFNTVDDGVTEALMSFADSSVPDQRFFLWLQGNIAGDLIRFTANASSASTTTGFTINTWHHACGVASDTTNRAVFIDGGSKGTVSSAQTVTGLDITSIGMLRDSTPSSEFDGRIAETAIWNIALSDDEVAILGAGYSPLFVHPQNLVFYAPLIRDLIDRIENVTISLGGTPTVANHPPIIYPSSLLIPQPAIAAVGVLSPYYYHNLLSV